MKLVTFNIRCDWGQVDESLRQTEEIISSALNEVRDTRMKFRAVTEAQEQRKNVKADAEV